MASTIQVGSILIENRPLILRALDLESESYSGAWSVLQSHTSFTLDQKIRGSGWNCFFMAAEVKSTVFGGLAAKSLLRALKQIFAKVQKPDFNCLEITKIDQGRFLGVPYITVCAHSRHIQQGSLLECAIARLGSKNVFTNSN
jgi:hypothetical protein